MQVRSLRATLADACLVACLLAFPAPASSQEVTFSDLEGMTIEASFKRDQINDAGAGRQVPAQVDGNWTVTVTAGTQIHFTYNATGHGAQGSKKAAPLGGTAVLNQSWKATSSVQGELVWDFAGGTLSFVRTLPSGAYRAQFAFARGSGGLTCAYRDAFAREQGKGPVRLLSPYSGEMTTIISTKVVTSSCKVSR